MKHVNLAIADGAIGLLNAAGTGCDQVKGSAASTPVVAKRSR
jgi:hypothetical protein